MTEEKKKIGFFTDSEGNPSSMRLMYTMGAFCILGVWTLVSIVNMQMTAIGYEHAALLGVCFSGKVGQSFMEKKKV